MQMLLHILKGSTRPVESRSGAQENILMGPYHNLIS